jgi:hypothetical protein
VTTLMISPTCARSYAGIPCSTRPAGYGGDPGRIRTAEAILPVARTLDEAIATVTPFLGPPRTGRRVAGGTAERPVDLIAPVVAPRPVPRVTP